MRPADLFHSLGNLSEIHKARVNDHPNGASDDRRNGAISKWPKSGSQTGSKRLIFTPFHLADLVVF
jgi:hypothetical protein